MTNFTFSLSVKQENFASTRERFERFPDKLTNAMRRGTTRSIRQMESDVAEIMRSRAGGVFWDIIPVVVPTPNGAHGRLRTPPSKPHRIEPTKKHGLLVFEGDDGTVFVRGGVNHPGSNPLDWPRDVPPFEPRYEEFFNQEVGEVLL